MFSIRVIFFCFRTWNKSNWQSYIGSDWLVKYLFDRIYWAKTRKMNKNNNFKWNTAQKLFIYFVLGCNSYQKTFWNEILSNDNLQRQCWKFLKHQPCFRSFNNFGCSLKVWFDEYLQWDPNDYDNVTTFFILPHKIWLPDLVVYNK